MKLDLSNLSVRDWENISQLANKAYQEGHTSGKFLERYAIIYAAIQAFLHFLSSKGYEVVKKQEK